LENRASEAALDNHCYLEDMFSNAQPASVQLCAMSEHWDHSRNTAFEKPSE
jgi:hypothetical protein